MQTVPSEYEQTRQKIRQRAFEIWEADGRPEGREADFWHQAEEELKNKPLTQGG